MVADAVLEWEVITAHGEHLIVTPYNHTDLYWALSGGGAGTFGVVLSMTTNIFPDGPIGSGLLFFNATENYWDAIQDLLAFLSQFVDAGPNTWDFAITPTGFQAYAITVPDKNTTEVQKLLQPFLDGLTKWGINYTYIPVKSANYLEYFSEGFGAGVSGAGPANIQLASRLIPCAGVLNSTQNKAIVDAIRGFVDNKYCTIGCHALNVKDIEYPDNAVLPRWRDAVATCNIVSYWDWNVTLAEMRARKKLLVNTLIPALERATPRSGHILKRNRCSVEGQLDQGSVRRELPPIA